MFKNTRRNRVKVLMITAALICCVTVLNSPLSPDLYFLNFNFEDVTCYQEHVSESQLGEDLNPSVRSIFFHETSCSGELNSRQSCAVEAAARAHKHFDINVIFLSPIRSLKTRSFQALREFERIKFTRINILKYANNTPLETLVAGGALSRTKWRISHTSDALRYLTLYKWGGIYLDLDTVVVKSLSGLGNNWSARESDFNVAAGAMAFSRDRVGLMFAEAAVSDLAKNFRGDSWGQNGPGVITRILKEKCGTSDLTAMNAAVCQGFEVYSPELFYPIRWQDANKYFEPGEINEAPYVYHVWNRITRHTKIVNTSIYAELARRYCPNVYEAYGDEFGN